MTLTRCAEGGGWSYRPDGKTIGFPECVHTLVSCVTGGGNLLLNTGPMPTGEIVPDQVLRLQEMGQWLAKYGQSIYGTRGGPYVSGRWGGSAYHGNKVYLHVFEWRRDSLALGPLKENIVASRVLTGGDVRIAQTAKGLDVTLSKAQHDPVDTIIELTLDQPVTEIQKAAAERPLAEDPACQRIISEGASISSFSSRADKGGDGSALFTTKRVVTGAAFRTAPEVAPWVVVDLGMVKTVCGVRFESGSVVHAPAATLSLSEDGKTWLLAAEAQHCPEVWESLLTQMQAGAEVPGRAARYLKLALKFKRPSPLLLHHIEVYGKDKSEP